MAKRVLFCATVDYHFKAFHLPYMKWFKEQGWEVDVAASGEINLPYTDKKYNIPIQRSPFHRENIHAYQQLKGIIKQNDYAIIHCHTPLGGVLARLAAGEARRKGTKVIYTAHGFHFCKGAPRINWLIYYPIEKYLSRYTDCLITINTEDYNLATKHRFKAGGVTQVNGVGVDTEQFKPVDENKKGDLKKSFGYQADDFLLFNAAEFNKNKNQQFLIQVMAHVKKKVPHAKLLLAGEGPLLETCKKLASTLGVSHMVDFLGFKKDIQQFLPMCDLAVASSFREGLPVNVMEAMACGLPVVAVDNRGHRELIRNDQTGWILADWDPVEFSKKVVILEKKLEMKNKFGLNGRSDILLKYSTSNVLLQNSQIYLSQMEQRRGTRWAIH